MSYYDTENYSINNTTPLHGIPQKSKLNTHHNVKTNCSDFQRSFGRPKTTSTPLHYPRDGSSLTPTLRRYSMADTCLTPPLYKEAAKYNPNQAVHSPSEFSNTCFNTRMSTHIDSHSPGYAGRVVQYNEEKERSLPIYQSRYDSPGIFPIVHLFKKDLPILKRKPRQVTVRINSSELSKYNSPEQNRMLLERIIRSTPGNNVVSLHNNEVNTRSVLDALKEISRKRIHSSEEEFILKEDGKRRRVDCVGESHSQKRLKENLTQMEDSNTVKNLSVKCSMDELMASHTSMDGQSEEYPEKEKKRESTSSSSKDSKRLKFIDVETQTICPQIETIVEPETESEQVEKENKDANKTKQEDKIKKLSPIKIFDEKPLETMRKNRLIVLMGSLSEHKIKAVENEDDHITKHNVEKLEDKATPEKPLVSILSSSKGPHKSSKHVTFNIPDVPNPTVAIDSSDVSSLSPASKAVDNNSSNLRNGSYVVTKTSAALVTPIVSSNITELSASNKREVEKGNDNRHPPSICDDDNTASASSFQNKSSMDTVIPFKSTLPISDPFPIVKPVEFVTNVEVKSTPTSVFSFDTKSDKSGVGDRSNEKIRGDGISTLDKSASSASTAIIPNKLTSLVYFGKGANQTFTNFSFGHKSNSPSIDVSKSSVGEKLPGFKFDLKQPQVTATNFSNLQPAQTCQKSEADVKSFPSSLSAVNTSMFPQVATSTNAANKENFSFFTVPTTVSSTAVPFRGSSSNFGGTNLNFGVPSVSTKENQHVTSAPTFGINSAGATAPLSSVFAVSEVGLKAATTNSTTGVIVSTFNATSNLTTKSPMFTFGPNSNGTVTFAPGFNSAAPGMFASNAKSTFPTTNTAPTLPFRSASTLPLEPAAATPNFDARPNITFGDPSTTFNKPITTLGPSNSSFGTMPDGLNTRTPTTSSSAPSFGMMSPPTFNTSASMFGGGNLNVPNFGNNVATPSSIFGTGSLPPFGTTAPTTTSAFSSNSVQTFGTTNAFAATTTTNIFGNTATFGTPTTSAPNFGSNTTTNFGGGNFGTNQNTAFNNNHTNEFRSNTTPAFGNPNSSAFCIVTSAPSFNSSAGFNQSNNAFGSTFGATASFEKSQNVKLTPFGSGNNTFGGGGGGGGGGGNFSTKPPTSQGEIFTFGLNSNPKPAVFSFGVSEPPKPTFNFTVENNSNIFGVGNKSFGGSAAPTFNSMSTPQFNAQPSVPGMFNIGTGSSTPSRSRTQLKAKRRT